MCENKRSRAVNFSPREQNLLFSIALKYKDILENKRTNSATNTAKHEAWGKVSAEFNATSADFNHRSVEQLKRLYENKRMLARKKKADARRDVLKTGGGPPPKNNEDELVLATMDPVTYEGLASPFDSDNVASINIDKGVDQLDEIELIFDPQCAQSKVNEMTKDLGDHIINENKIENDKCNESQKSTASYNILSKDLEENEVNFDRYGV
ncbi:unnamed protein product [Acanthoscelides obtectus]|uniref:Regulatory protein zeste n=1 Tax=Acanthoscelides obtectus TaxID=200917 RepID=A0A9P0PA59_ACAOB|nr:unnamed protein product [Acanthoscelides obtectus]CAH2020490.1 unnamed protein product [Acanthoscelides obtectus]CAK1655811.1 Myb/SANT-like DNA-binding domain-containing protein 3 [Acanthoscelides obtectus]CAK1682652.1 Myb/SANT-like DNA-binding domain-containing protein 3 [Acanthoscelides obtectus]